MTWRRRRTSCIRPQSSASKKAQTLFINVFAPSATAAELPETDVWISWLKPPPRRATQRHSTDSKIISTSSWSRISRGRKNESWDKPGYQVERMGPAIVAPSAEVLSAPSFELLFWAIVEYDPDAVEACIRGRSDLLERQVGAVGEFPLLAACRLSRTSIAKKLDDPEPRRRGVE